MNPDSVKSIVTHLLRDATEVCLCTVEEMCYFLESLLLKMGAIGCPETSVRNYHYTLRNSPEARSSHTGYMFVA